MKKATGSEKAEKEAEKEASGGREAAALVRTQRRNQQ